MRINIRFLTTTALMASMVAATPAFASEETELLREQIKLLEARLAVLEKKDTENTKQVEEANARAEKAIDEANARASAAIDAAAAQAQASVQEATAKAAANLKPAAGGAPDDIKISFDPAPKFETADGAYSFKVGGFAQLDAGIYNDDKSDRGDGTNARRVRLNASGTIARDWAYKIENDFAGNASALTDVYLQYNGFKNVSLTAGQFKEPFSLETLTSDLFVSFIERASPTVFSPDRQMGLAVSTWWDDTAIGDGSFSVGAFGSGTGVASTDDEARSVTGRVTFAPINEEGKLLHLGLGASYRIPLAATDSVTYGYFPEARITSTNMVNTGAITLTDHVLLTDLEAAGTLGPLGVQGEYIRASVDRNTGLADVDLDGWYAEASYFLTGESKKYKSKEGKFDRVKPKNPFSLSGGGWGAWQLSARYSTLDLNDIGSGITGGEMDNITLGVRWTPVANVSVLANYIMVDTDRNAVVANDDPDIWLLRTQFDF